MLKIKKYKELCLILSLMLLPLILLGCGGNADERENDNIGKAETALSDTIDGDADNEKVTETITETDTSCDHVFGEWKTVTPAGCELPGEEERICEKCSCSEVKTMEALGHTIVIDEGYSATCTDAGLSDGEHCELCGDVITQQTEIAASGHVEVTADPIAATCESEGLEDRTFCELCGVTINEGKTIEKTSHTPVTDAAVAATAEKNGLTEGSHCKYCKKVLKAQEVIPVLESRNGGYITTKKTTIKADHVTFTIPKNVFVRDDLVEWTNIVTKVMEDITGFKFEGKSAYSDGVIECEVKKNGNNEYGGALALPGEIMLCPFDLFTTNGGALYHELVHTLQFAQSEWRYSELTMEGFAVYSTYKGILYLEEHYPEIAFALESNEAAFLNMSLKNYEKLYEHPMEYWMENIMGMEYSSNGNYVIGFRFMWYLDEIYGNYTDWITEYEKLNPYKNAKNNTMTAKMEAEAFKLAYGDDVFANFYPWLKQHEEMFDFREKKDITYLHFAQIYPSFYYAETFVSIPPVRIGMEVTYRDLTFDLEPAKFYLSKYKGKNIDSLVLIINKDVEVELYDFGGNLIGVKIGPRIALDGVSSIRLAGEGTITIFRIEGFY